MLETVPSSFHIFGLTFHLYGLIVGISILLGLWLTEKVVAAAGFGSHSFWKLAIAVLIGGVIGARAWHVMTDWPLYQDHLLSALQIWQGGLSILGAVVGGSAAAYIVTRLYPAMVNIPLAVFFDAAALSLPFAQAVGRLGNWLNQELFGSPSNLPWAIFIDEAHRPLIVRQFSRFHPLFAYEAVAMILVGVILWWFYKKQMQTVGTGFFFSLYLLLYSGIRFVLDFLRIEKAMLPGTSLGFNQGTLLLVTLGSGSWLLWHCWWRNRVKKAGQ